MRVSTESVVMRDKARLAVDIYRPQDDESHPVLVMLTPYGRGNLQVFADILVPRGYALAVGDVRGRYDSEGEYLPVSQERTDVPDVIDWLASQSWYDAAAGMGVVGISYLAAVGFIAAARRPEHVRALLNIGGFSDTYELTHRGGAMVLHHLLPWSILTSFSPQPSLDGIDWREAYSALPLREAAERAGHDNDLWRWSVDHPQKDEEWEAMDLEDLLDEIDVPTLHISGWYDLCLGTTVALYRRFARRANSPQRLVIGPWSHNGVLMGPTELCGVDFGPQSRPDMPAEIVGWFDRHLKCATVETVRVQEEKREPVRVFLTGVNRWLEMGEWPPCESERLDLFLSPGGLTRSLPPEEGGVPYTYDPNRPTPTRGGGVWEFPAAGLQPGPADQAPLHCRDDLLVYCSPVLTEEVTAAGPVRSVLHAQTDGETTDFTAKLLDIAPDGTARIVGDGIARAHLWADPTRARPVPPGDVARYEIDMWWVGHTFRPGHRIGLEVASASFPKWDRNLNSPDGCPRPARQVIYWGGELASRLELYVW